MRRAVVVLALALIVASCSGSRGDHAGRPSSSTTKGGTVASSRPPGANPGTYGVGQLTETFVDTSRPTQGAGADDSAPTRTLVTLIWYPEGVGPFPLIVLAHGRGGHPNKFSQLVGAWASAGYVVAAPVFPLTSNQSPKVNVGDYVNQPADMSFVISRLVDANRARGGPLTGRIDAKRIGVAGLSLGGATVYGVAFDSCCRDRRVGAALVMAGSLLPFGDTNEFPSVPLLIIHGNGDTEGRDPYGIASPPKYLMTLERPTHSAPFEDATDPADDLVVAVTVDFWHAYLDGQASARGALATDAMVPGVATLEQQT